MFVSDFSGCTQDTDGTASRRSALASLHFFDYDAEYLLPKGSELKRPPDQMPPGTSSWDLDVPVIDRMDYAELRRLPAHDAALREEALAGVDLVDDPEKFTALFRVPTTELMKGKHKRLRSYAFEQYLPKLKARDYVSEISARRVKSVIKGFCQQKPKKELNRAVLDGRPINEAQRKPPSVKLTDLNDIEAAVRGYDYYCELDGKGFFHQFGMHKDVCAFWVLLMGGKKYMWTRMPMGWSYSVRVAHNVCLLLASFDSGCIILCYIDNVYIFGKSRAEVDEAVAIFLQRCKQVRATFEISTPTTTAGTILGVHCDLSEKTLSMPEKFVGKLKALESQIEDLFKNEFVPTRLLWKLFGNVNWSVRALDIHTYPYTRFYAWLSERARLLHEKPHLWDRPCHIWPKALADLKALTSAVIKNKPRYLLHATSGRLHTVFADASNVGMGVVHASDLLRDVLAMRWTESMRKHTIALRELYAAVMAVHDSVRRIPRLGHLLLKEDNTNCIAWLRKKRANTFFGNRLLAELYGALGRTFLEIDYVASDQQLADHPSRYPHLYRGFDRTPFSDGALTHGVPQKSSPIGQFKNRPDVLPLLVENGFREKEELLMNELERILSN